MITARIKKHYRAWRRWHEANQRGWGSLGEMFACGREWSQAQWDRKIRRSNRLYRLAHHGNPWKPYRGF